MTSHRKIFLTPTLLAVLATVVPASASANPLLSGYGGPGAGNQAILGSTLIGGGGGSAGAPGGSGTNESAVPAGSSASAAAGAGGSGNGEAASVGSSGRGSKAADQGAGLPAGGTHGSRGGIGKASGGAAGAYPTSSREAAFQTTSAASRTLGLSTDDLGYVLLAIVALGLTGVLTRWLARAPSRPEGV